MQRCQRHPKVRISLVGAHHEAAGLGDGEIHSRERGVRREELSTQVFPRRGRECGGIGQSSRRAKMFVEGRSNFRALQVDGGHDDVARMHALSAKARAGTLTPEEDSEMDNFERVGSILSTLKSKARQVLKRSSRSA